MSFVSKITYFYMTTKTLADTIDSMSDEELVANMRQSVKDLRANNVDGNSFGASILRSAIQRANDRRAEASRANGRLGGRPKGSKNKKTLEREAAQKALETALEAKKASNTSKSTTPPQKPPKKPLKCQLVGKKNMVYHVPTENDRKIPDIAELYDFASKYSLDDVDAREWFDMTSYRHWTDRYGNVIENWKGACRNFCRARAASRIQESGPKEFQPKIKVPPSPAMFKSTTTDLSNMDIQEELANALRAVGAAR